MGGYKLDLMRHKKRVFWRGEGREAWRHLRALGEESLGFEDGLQAAARDRGDDASHHSAIVFSSLFFVFPCFSF